MRSEELRGSYASDYKQSKSNAKPIIPFCEAKREGDRAVGVVVGSSLTVILQ